MKKLIVLLLLTTFGLLSFALDLPKRPEPPTLVTDFANVFSQAERNHLESKLVSFFANTSTQIAVVTVNDLQGYDKADYAFRLGEAWGIGSKEFNNGILVLLKSKTADSNGEVFIAVGYGLEGVVPDMTARQIADHEMIPRFKENDMFGGVDQATNVLIDLTRGEYNHKQYAKKAGGRGFNPFIIFILLFVVFPMLFGRRRKGFYSAGNRSSLPFWLALGMMSGAGRNHSGSFGNFSSGSGSFGGGSSFGSFGGFGGGGFGGGGAGGSW